MPRHALPLRRLLVLAHRYIGLTLGLWFVLLGLTGALLVYRDALDRWLNPALLTSRADGPLLGPLAIHRAALAAHPGAHVDRIKLPIELSDAYQVLLRKDARLRVGSPRFEAMFDAVDARALGTRDPDQRSLRPPALLQTIYDLHHRVLLGNSGKDLVGLVGIVLLVAVTFGLVLAFPNLRRASLRRAVTIKLRASGKRALYDLHRAVGVFAAALLFIAGLTGTLMAYPEYARDLVGLASPVRSMPEVPWRTRTEESADFALSIANVARQYPTHTIREIHFPPPRGSALLFFYIHHASDIHRLGDTVVVFDAGSGEMLVERSRRTRTAGESLLHWLFPLHSGTAFGTVGKVLAVAAGLALAALFGTGLFVWFTKRNAERSAAMRRRVLVQDRKSSHSHHAIR
jgi:uncharacterized iron-regulated membrane protein